MCNRALNSNCKRFNQESFITNSFYILKLSTPTESHASIVVMSAGPTTIVLFASIVRVRTFSLLDPHSTVRLELALTALMLILNKSSLLTGTRYRLPKLSGDSVGQSN